MVKKLILTLTENADFKRNFKNFFGIFKKKVDVEGKIFKNIQVRNIFVNKKVAGNYLKRFFGNNVKAILCSKKLKLLKKHNLKIYRPCEEFFINLCINVFFKILDLAKIEPGKLNFAIFDPNGCFVNLLRYLIFYSKNITVVSNNLNIYEKEREYLLKNYGATFFLSNDFNYLFKEKIIFAPKKIDCKLPLRKDSIVFTSEKTDFPLSGTIYSKYKFSNILELQKILPVSISQEYFLAALYDVYNIKKIKNFVPDFCFNGTRYELIQDIKKKFSSY